MRKINPYRNQFKLGKSGFDLHTILSKNILPFALYKSNSILADYRNKLTGQGLNRPYMVLCHFSTNGSNATVIKRSELEPDFIVDNKTYFLNTENIYEAYYIAAFLNSNTPANVLKNFQSQSLTGEDEYKNILDIYCPEFNEKNTAHIQLAQLSELAHKKVKEYITNHPTEQEPSAPVLRKLRTSIKKHLEKELQLIDTIVIDQLMRAVVL